MMSARNISVLLLILNSLAWSTLGIYIRILGAHFLVLQQVYLRVFVAALLVGILGFRQIRWRTFLQRLDMADWLLIIIRTSCMYLLGVGLTSVAFLAGEYSTISLIKALPFTAIFGLLIFHEPATKLKVLFIVLSFLGASLLLLSDLGQVFAGEFVSWGWAELMAFISAAFLAFSYGARKWQKASPDGTSVNNWESTFLMFVLGVPILVVASWIMGEGALATENLLVPQALFALCMSGLLNALGLVFINYALGHIDIVLANNIFALQPAFGVFVGILIYRDVTTIWEIAGGLIIVGSLIGMNNVSANIGWGSKSGWLSASHRKSDSPITPK